MVQEATAVYNNNNIFISGIRLFKWLSAISMNLINLTAIMYERPETLLNIHRTKLASVKNEFIAIIVNGSQ